MKSKFPVTPPDPSGRFTWQKPGFGGRVRITSGEHTGRHGRKIAVQAHKALIRTGPLAWLGIGPRIELPHLTGYREAYRMPAAHRKVRYWTDKHRGRAYLRVLERGRQPRRVSVKAWITSHTPVYRMRRDPRTGVQHRDDLVITRTQNAQWKRMQRANPAYRRATQISRSGRVAGVRPSRKRAARS